MAKKEVIYQGLSDLNVLIDDTTQYSPDYFRVTNLPGEFTAGINVFKFKGNAALFPENSPLYIEVLDANGLPVYYEIGLDLESQEQSAIISVYINEDTVPGNGSITICGQANQSSEGQILDASEINVRWSVPVYIDISKRNVDEIIFDELPKVTITATTGSYSNLQYGTGVPSPTKEDAEAWYNISYIYRNGEATLYTSSFSNPAFPEGATNTTLLIYYGDITDDNQRTNDEISYSSAAFTSSISSYSGSGIAYLTDPIIFQVNNSSEQHIVQSGIIGYMDVVYDKPVKPGSSIPTENTHNIAIVQFSGLQPQIGEIAKIRSYYKSAGVQEYIFSNETDISDLADEFGFTANVVTASFALPTIHRNDKFDFKFEFINPSGYVSKQVLEYRNVLFQGGNTYIGGEDNLITGSLYVAGSTGTGVHISGKGNAAMIRSIGYEGFTKASLPGGKGGFVIYSGSVQPLLNATENYSGVGIELFANTASYFKYTTSGSGLLDIRTDSFFLGSQNQFISGANGNIEISSSNFHLDANGDVGMSGNINANTGIFKDVNIIGQIAAATTIGPTVFTGGYLKVLESWVTGSSNITATKAGDIVKLPLTFSNAGAGNFPGSVLKRFKPGMIEWKGECIGYTYDFESGVSTPYAEKNFASASAAITASAYTTRKSASIVFDASIDLPNMILEGGYTGTPTTFKNWGSIVGYDGHEYNQDANGNYLSASIDTVIFPVFPLILDPISAQPYTLSIISEILNVGVSNTVQNPLSLQFQAKFINGTSNWLYSSGAPAATATNRQIMYDCKFKVEIYNGNDVLILEDVKLQETEQDWLDFNVPLTAALINNPSYNVGFLIGETISALRIKLSWQVLKHRAPFGHTVGDDPSHVRITELRIVQLPSSIGLAASAIKFSDSYLASGTNSTLVQGNFIPVEDITYDLGSSAQNPQSDYSGYQEVGGVAQKRWNNIYGKFLSADAGIAVGSSFALQATGSIATGYKSIAAGEYSHAEGGETITGRRLFVNNGSDNNIFLWPLSPGDYYISNSHPYYYAEDPAKSNFTSSITVGDTNILTIGNGPSYYNTDPYIQKDIVTCTETRFISASWYTAGLRYATIFHLEISSSTGASIPYTEDIVSITQLNNTTGAGAHAEGYYTEAAGIGSHSEGQQTIADGDYSHAEGYYNIAFGDYSHIEGAYNIAEGYGSHAEGIGARAIGSYSHVEGVNNIALQIGSHVAGIGNVASGSYQSVIGEYCISSSIRGAFILGNGINNNSNITGSNLIFAYGTGSSGKVEITGALLVAGSATATAGFIKPGAGAVYLLADGSTTAGTGGSPFPYTGAAQITGSLNVSGSITGSLQGTASFAVSASWAPGSSGVTGGTLNYIPLWTGISGLSISALFQSASNVGIGTVTPTQKLEVNGYVLADRYYPKNSNATYIDGDTGGTTVAGTGYFYVNTAGGAYFQNITRFRGAVINDTGTYLNIQGGTSGHTYFSGNVGIGTTTPNANLDVSGSAIITGSLLIGTGSSFAAGFGFTPNVSIGMNTGSTGAVLDLKNTSTTGTISGSTLGTIQFGNSTYTTSQIIATQAGGISGGDSGGGHIAIWTNPAGTGVHPVERFRITSTGNVGIGTKTPGYALDVAGSGNATSDFRAPIFYDSNDTSYYVNPASTSRLNSLVVVGTMTGTLVGTASYANTASLLNSTTNAFIQSGNSFGTAALLGTNDNQSLALETSGSTRIFISSTGNVGINNPTPLVQTHIRYARIGGATNNTIAGLFIDAYHGEATAPTVGSSIYLRSSRSDTLGTNTVSVNGDDSRIRFHFNDGTGFEPSAEINASVDGIPAAGSVAGKLQFKTTTTGAGAPSTKMTILQSGNVGIGTTTPTSKLQVVGLVSYADNAAAIAGGLTVGAFYHTSGVVKVVI